MKTAKIFTPSGGGERDNHPQMEIHLHKISDSARCREILKDKVDYCSSTIKDLDSNIVQNFLKSE
jgi:hypothetical protein